MSDSNPGANGRQKLNPAISKDNSPVQNPRTQQFVHTERLKKNTATVLIQPKLAQPLVNIAKANQPVGDPPQLPLPKKHNTDTDPVQAARELPFDLHAALESTPVSGETWSPKPNERFASLQAVKLLGVGGMSEVWECTDTSLHRKVAVKVLLGQRSPEQTKRLVQEARAMAACSHENICGILYVGTHKGTPYITMQHLAGRTLAQLPKPMRPSDVAIVGTSMGSALVCAHAHSTIHRDLKQSNVMVVSGTGDENAVGEIGECLIKVLDFGIAHADPSVSASTSSEARAKALGSDVVGTPTSMAREQWIAPGTVSDRTDVYGLCLILWELLAGYNPHQSRSHAEIYEFHKLGKSLPGIRVINPTVPQGMADLIDRGLRVNQNERPSAAELVKELKPFITTQSRLIPAVVDSAYPGLRPLQESDEKDCYGRTAITAELLERLKNQSALAIIGPSGGGKTSIVLATMVPALRRDGAEVYVIRPGTAPLETFANILSQMSGSISDSWENISDKQDKLIKRLYKDPSYFGRSIRNHAQSNNRTVVIFLDQGEEIFSLVPEKERQPALACISGLIGDPGSPAKLLMTLRSDAIDRIVDEFPKLITQLAHVNALFFLGPLKASDLRDALTLPAEARGYRFESPEIMDDMLRYLGATRDALPLAAFAIRYLWGERDPDKKLITLQSYKKMGGIALALAKYADQLMFELTPPARKIACDLLIQLVNPDHTRAILPLKEVKGLSSDQKEVEQTLERLEKARLVTIHKSDSHATIELVHESLIKTWPSLQKLLSASGEDLAFMEQVRVAARQWDANDRDAGLLWTGDIIADAKAFYKRNKSLPQIQQDFLEAAFKKQESAARRRKIFVGGFIGFLGVLALVSLVVAGVVLRANYRAEAESKAARKAEAVAKIAAENEKVAKVEALKAAEDARLAERQAQNKELERAEAAKRVEEANASLLGALKNEADARRAATNNSKKARRAEAKALAAADRLKELLETERERVRVLQNSTGGETYWPYEK